MTSPIHVTELQRSLVIDKYAWWSKDNLYFPSKDCVTQARIIDTQI